MTTIMQILSALPSLIKVIVELMALAEQAMGAGKGAEKKQSVLDTLQAVVGNNDLWEKVKSLFSGIVNMAALFHFGSTGKEPTK